MRKQAQRSEGFAQGHTAGKQQGQDSAAGDSILRLWLGYSLRPFQRPDSLTQVRKVRWVTPEPPLQAPLRVYATTFQVNSVQYVVSDYKLCFLYSMF